MLVTTHSPIFCDAVLKIARERNKGRVKAGDIGLFNVRRTPDGTTVEEFKTVGLLFENQEILKSLTASTEDGLFEGLMLRGMLDE